SGNKKKFLRLYDMKKSCLLHIVLLSYHHWLLILEAFSYY
ncbi:MAG: hypothetical protein ACI9E3_000451, partial [Flavobacteriales bacterium]